MKRFLIGTLTLLAVALAVEVPQVQPKDLAAQLAKKGSAPALIHVGPNVLYRSRHIPGSIYAGMAARSEGLEGLKAVVKDMPRDRDIVLYCGCCPWDHCPNIAPAIALLKQMGFTRVKALYIANNFRSDWTDHGYPVEP